MRWRMICEIIFVVFLFPKMISTTDAPKAAADGGSLALSIKDDGLVELHKGDQAMVFYLTSTNTGHEPLHLKVENKKCCQTITKDDEDCESMVLIGGDMGELFPQDTRNLTLLFPNLYLHERVGECEIEISSKGGKMTHKVKFNTTIPRSPGARIPRLMEQYYSAEDVQKCESVDEDPLNACKSVNCFIKYNGFRNFFNHSNNRCEKLTNCTSEKADNPDQAYVIVSNQCRKISGKKLADEDFEFFRAGVPGPSLTHVHSYPMNVHCYNGEIDKSHGFCACKPGWKSAPFDRATFNPDVQVYHMCTVWTGEMTAAEAANITVYPKESNVTGYVIFSLITVSFVILFTVLAVTWYRRRAKNLEKHPFDEQLGEEETKKLKEHEDEEEDSSP